MVLTATNDLYHNSLTDNNPCSEISGGEVELKNNTTALIDKMIIHGIDVKDVKDIRGLIDRDIVTVKEGKSTYLFNDNGEGYSSIRITETELFDSFEYGLTRWGTIRSVMQLSVNDPKYKNLNCYTVEDYKNRILQIQKYLFDRYGIETCFDNARVVYIEINKTIVLNTYYENYRRILELLCSLFPQKLRLKKNGEFETFTSSRRPTEIKKSTETFSRSSGKNGITIEIYNKSKELEEVYEINLMYNYLRFEIKLRSGTKIKNELGSNLFWSLDDDGINSFFTNFIINSVENPYYKYCTDRDKKIKKILKETYRPRSTTWIRDSIIKICGIELERDIPLTININEVVDMLDNLPFLSRQCKYNAKRSFQTVADENIKEYTKMDTNAYIELITKLK